MTYVATGRWFATLVARVYALDDSGTEPWEAAAYEIALINIYEGGRSYDGQYRQWLDAAGFTNFRRELMANNMSLIRAVRG